MLDMALDWFEPRNKALPGGRVRIALKRAWSDGTMALELSRLELVERLVSLVPPPRANQVHYHGVLASRSRLRGRVRPKAPRRPSCTGTATVEAAEGSCVSPGVSLGVLALRPSSRTPA